jgi:hypothetical protein
MIVKNSQHRQTDGRTDRRKDERMDGQMADRRTDRQTGIVTLPPFKTLKAYFSPNSCLLGTA